MRIISTMLAVAAIPPPAACNKSPSDKLADCVENAADARADGMEAKTDVLRN